MKVPKEQNEIKKLDAEPLESELEEDLDIDNVPEDELKEDKLTEDELKDDDLFNDDFQDDFFGETSQTPLQKHQDLLRDLTNFSPYLKESLNNWLGLTWNEKDKEFKKAEGLKPIMTINGAAWCVGLLKTYTRGNNIITNISSDEYTAIMEDHIDAIWLNLGTREDIGIKEDGDLIRVANEMEHAAALALMGAGEGKYTTFLGSTFNYSTHATLNPNQPIAQFGGQVAPIVQQPKKMGFVGKVKNALIGQGY